MKKILVFFLAVIMVLSLAACGRDDMKADDSQQISETLEQTAQTEQAEQTETVYIATEADDFEKYGLDDGLNEADIDLVRNLYSQISENYMTLQDSNTEQVTRNPIDIWMVNIVYFGEEPIVGCRYCYITSDSKRNEFALAFGMDDQGNLSNIDFDILQFISANSNQYGTTSGDVVIAAAAIGAIVNGKTHLVNESNMIKVITQMYADYKKLRQEKFGDVYEVTESYTDKLDENQSKLLNNILDAEDEWGYYYDSWDAKNLPCIYIKVWNFGDGTAEILCMHGTVDYHNVAGISQYSGENHGYAVGNGSISPLDDNGLKRLENDLSNTEKLYWSPEWADKVKEEKLAEYIYKIIK